MTMNTTQQLPLNLARTAAALAAYDAAGAKLDNDQSMEALRTYDAAKIEVGHAFAFDTADRNDPSVAASWAAFNPERIRDLVDEYRANLDAGRPIAPPVNVTFTTARLAGSV